MRTAMHLSAMRHWIGLSLLLLAGSATGKEATASCTPAKARATTIEAIQNHYESWRGACVRVSGIAWRAKLLADREALLDLRDSYDDVQKRSLHLYGVSRLRRARPVQVEVTGTVGSCADHHAATEALQAREPGAIIMTSGYCHTSMETYIRPVSTRMLSRAPIPRLREAEVPPERRGLVIAPVDLPRYAEQVEAARSLIEAVARGDEKRFVKLDSVEIAGPGEDGVKERNAESRARFRAASRSRDQFAALLQAGAPRVFVARDELEAGRAESRSSSPLLVCWCKTADCEGRWPVTRDDADNAPERPQICVATNEYTVFRGAPVIQAEFETVPGGFAEPS